MSELPLKIGLFGGSFDPVHNAHIKLARTAYEKFRLNKVVFLPTSKNPLKPSAPLASVEDRLQMIRLAISRYDFCEVSDLDCREDQKPGYSIDTVSAFLADFRDPRPQLYFLLGTDNLGNLHKWKEYKKLLSLCTFVFFGRDSVDQDQLRTFNPNLSGQEIGSIIENFIPFDAQVSSSLIREAIKTGQFETIKNTLDPLVSEFILQKALYR